MNWFTVDKEGLAKLVSRRSPAFALFEVISNAWDTSASSVAINFEPVKGVAKARLTVEDNDPEGFKDLSHAFTLFAESEKKTKSQTRGRFNLGEKLVLALCDEATILSTKGGVHFDSKGRHAVKKAREHGSSVEMLLRLTREEYADAVEAVKTLLPPQGISTTFNGEALTAPALLASFKVELPTEIADAEGLLKRSRRKTTVNLYEVREGEKAAVYELGVPVVETGDRWHVDVQQKVPLNMDRDNVPPAFLRELRTAVVNHMHSQLTKEDANQPWVREATSDVRCEPEATEQVMTLRFGDKRVAYDPSDIEANSLAVAKGYTVVHGGMLNKTEWANAKVAGSVPPAGQVTPSPKPYSEDGDPLKLLPESKYTPGIRSIVDYATALGPLLMKRNVHVRIANEITWPFLATYGSGQLTLNLGRLGHSFFNHGPSAEVNRLLIHEFGHEYASNHLSDEFHDALCALGAKLTDLALTDPTFFKKFTL